MPDNIRLFPHHKPEYSSALSAFRSDGKILQYICGNAADHDLLIEEGIEQADALVSLTGMDEENIILALFAKTKGVDKIVAKVNEDGRAQLVEELGIDLIVSAKTATADAIMSYVRARQNSLKNVNVESM